MIILSPMYQLARTIQSLNEATHGAARVQKFPPESSQPTRHSEQRKVSVNCGWNFRIHSVCVTSVTYTHGSSSFVSVTVVLPALGKLLVSGAPRAKSNLQHNTHSTARLTTPSSNRTSFVNTRQRGSESEREREREKPSRTRHES